MAQIIDDSEEVTVLASTLLISTPWMGGASFEIQGNQIGGQTFTLDNDCIITKVKVYATKTDNPGPFTLSIRATDGTIPTGPNLTSKTIDVSDKPDGLQWFEFPLDSTAITAGKWAYILSCPQASNNMIIWNSAQIQYAGGGMIYSFNNGSTWNHLDEDFTFEIWGV